MLLLSKLKSSCIHFTVAVLASTGFVRGEEPAAPSGSFTGGSAVRPFSLSTASDLIALRTTRDQAVAEAIRVLEKCSRGDYAADADEPERAIEVLSLCRTTNRDALAALCDNFNYTPVDGGEPGPLSRFPAAQALVAIGGAPACSAVFRSLRRPLERKELLLYAHVLAAIDPLSVMNERIRARLKAGEESRSSGITVTATEKKNLQQILDWINTEDFARKVEYDPTFIQVPKRSFAPKPLQ